MIYMTSSLQPHLWVHWKMHTNCKVGVENELSLIWYVEQRSSHLLKITTTVAAHVTPSPTLVSSSEVMIQCISKTMWCNLLTDMNVCFIHKRPPAPREVNNFGVYFLHKIEGGSTDVKGVPKGYAPAMGFENSVDVHKRVEGSVTAQRVKEWKSFKEPGRQSTSGKVKMSQNRWTLQMLKP